MKKINARDIFCKSDVKEVIKEVSNKNANKTIYNSHFLSLRSPCNKRLKLAK